MDRRPSILLPNARVSSGTRQLVVAVWCALVALAWATTRSARVPSPAEVASAFAGLWADGLGAALLVSYTVNLSALLLASAISLAVSYATVLPVFRPVGTLVSSVRFCGFTGLPFMLGAAVSDGHSLKIALLTIGMTLFFTSSMTTVVASVPREQLDHARTLGLSEWGVTLEVVVLGTRDQAIELIRQNAAMGWMMLTMVEGLYRGEGGVGVLLLNQSKYLNMAAVVALQATVLGVGLAQDFAISTLKSVACPYAALRTSKG